jgi:dynein intermediate chain
LVQATTPSSRKDLDDFVATLVGSGRGGGSSSVGTRPGLDGAATPSSPRKTNAGLATSEFGGSEGGPSAVTIYVNRSDGEDQGIASGRGRLVDSEVQTEITEAPKKVSCRQGKM